MELWSCGFANFLYYRLYPVRHQKKLPSAEKGYSMRRRVDYTSTVYGTSFTFLEISISQYVSFKILIEQKLINEKNLSLYKNHHTKNSSLKKTYHRKKIITAYHRKMLITQKTYHRKKTYHTKKLITEKNSSLKKIITGKKSSLKKHIEK